MITSKKELAAWVAADYAHSKCNIQWLPDLHTARIGSCSPICAICSIWNTIPISHGKCHGISCLGGIIGYGIDVT